MSTLAIDTIQGATVAGKVAMPAGHIIQVVASDTGDQSTSSTSFTATGLAATITPKFSSSKILVSVKGIGSHSGSDSHQVLFRMVRSIPSANTIVDGQGNFPYSGNQNGQGFACVEGARERYPVMCDLLDAPNTTSAIEYKCLFKINTGGSGTGYLGRWATDGNWNVRSQLTLMEIAQ